MKRSFTSNLIFATKSLFLIEINLLPVETTRALKQPYAKNFQLVAGPKS